MKCIVVLLASLSLCQAVGWDLVEASRVPIRSGDAVCEECKEAIPYVAWVLRNPTVLAFLESELLEYCEEFESAMECEEGIAWVKFYLKKYNYILDKPDTICQFLEYCANPRADFIQLAMGRAARYNALTAKSGNFERLYKLLKNANPIGSANFEVERLSKFFGLPASPVGASRIPLRSGDAVCEECKEAIPYVAWVLRNPTVLAYLETELLEYCEEFESTKECEEGIAWIKFYLKKYNYILDKPDTICQFLEYCPNPRADFIQLAMGRAGRYNALLARANKFERLYKLLKNAYPGGSANF